MPEGFQHGYSIILKYVKRDTVNSRFQKAPSIVDWHSFSSSSIGCCRIRTVHGAEFSVLVGASEIELVRGAVEHDNVGFDIEHSAEGSDFAPVAFEPGAGNTSSGASYRHALVDPGPGRHAYRLRQIDLDGSSTYSEVVEVFIESEAAFELGPAFPNPFAESTRLTLGVQRSQHVVVTVFDMLGRTVEVLFSDLVPANSRIPLFLDGGSLTSGVYVVHVEGETSVQNRSIVRLR